MTREEIITNIIPVLEQYPVSKASFFGSYARGSYTPSSDVDILVEFNAPKVGLMFYSLREDLVAILPVNIDLVHRPGIKYMEEEFQQNIEREELVFYEKDIEASI